MKNNIIRKNYGKFESLQNYKKDVMNINNDINFDNIGGLFKKFKKLGKI